MQRSLNNAQSRRTIGTINFENGRATQNVRAVTKAIISSSLTETIETQTACLLHIYDGLSISNTRNPNPHRARSTSCEVRKSCGRGSDIQRARAQSKSGHHTLQEIAAAWRSVETVLGLVNNHRNQSRPQAPLLSSHCDGRSW